MNYLSLKDLANELDDLRERSGCYEKDESEPPLDNDEQDKYNELIAMENALGDLHLYSRNINDCLIDESDFEEHIQNEMEELHPDLSHLPEVIKNNIDWANISEECECDYNEVEYEGNTYYIRAS